ncbi:MAG: PVC-type heme-binding CxxCH protein, partial [Opitutaceae bacterium]
REVVFTGFGEGASPLKSGQLFNSLRWGPDNRIYVAAAGNGGLVRRPDQPESAAIDLQDKDLSFDPHSFDIRLETGTAQYGQSFDAFGRRFVSSNHNPVRVPRYEYRYAEANPLVEFPTGLVDIVDPATELFRISPEEPWRVMRINMRASGRARGRVEAGGKPSGYFTSACGVTIYLGDALPEKFRGSAFVAEPANNLVHRAVIEEHGTGFRGKRPEEEEGIEFVRSEDIWFRPVNFANAPDGTLFIADMYRELIEDPQTIPEEIVQNLNLSAGNDMGRIYRVIPADGFEQPEPPNLSTVSANTLALLLEHPNGWYRNTAARLLYERQDIKVVPTLEKVARESARPEARVAALYALQGLQRLDPGLLVSAARDDDAHVREHAVRLAEMLWASPGLEEDQKESLREHVVRLTADPSARVRYQAAFTLGIVGGEDRDEALLALIERDAEDDLVRTAVLCSVGDEASDLFSAVTSREEFRSGAAGQIFIAQLIEFIGARGKAAEIARVVSFLSSHSELDATLRWTNALGAGLDRADLTLADADPEHRLDQLLSGALRVARDP